MLDDFRLCGRNAVMKHGQCARCVELAAEIARLTPYVEAFRREEARADKLGTEIDDLRDQLSAHAQRPLPMLADVAQVIANGWLRGTPVYDVAAEILREFDSAPAQRLPRSEEQP
jgi:hypothetical protein